MMMLIQGGELGYQVSYLYTYIFDIYVYLLVNSGINICSLCYTYVNLYP
jgi:hypothetical protein